MMLTRAGQLYASVAPTLVNRPIRNYYNRKITCLKENEAEKHLDMIQRSIPKWYPKPDVFREKPSNPEKQKFLDFQQLNEWSRNEQIQREIENQKYDEDRVAELGPDLAALHFFSYRKAAVKLEYHDKWIMGNLTRLAEQLPHSFLEGIHVEGIDCTCLSDGEIRFEALQYLADLDHLRWLSLRNQTHIDAWCIDRIAGLVGNSLEYLDISSCDLNIGCICALSKFSALETLIIKYPYQDYHTLWALSILEFKSPNLFIKVDTPDADDDAEEEKEIE